MTLNVILAASTFIFGILMLAFYISQRNSQQAVNRMRKINGEISKNVDKWWGKWNIKKNKYNDLIKKHEALKDSYNQLLSGPVVRFDTYQQRAGKTAQYPDRGRNLYYPTLGLAGEAGEVAEKVKKMMRDDAGILTDGRKEALRGEIGDVLWYIAAVCHEAGLSMEEVAQANIDKLADRHERGVIKGDGDNR